MALLWSHREKGVLYQVRAAGSSRRLYADGVLHTQFNPRRIVTGSVWDLLWLPVFFLTAPRVGSRGGCRYQATRHAVSAQRDRCCGK